MDAEWDNALDAESGDVLDAEWDALEERARCDADRGEYFAIRRLLALPRKEPVTVGLLGPYNHGQPDQTVYYTDTIWPGGRSFITTSGGDRLQAISLAVEMCRLHLVRLLKMYPEGLLELTGEYYANYDLPENPISPPPLNYDRVRHYRALVRKQGDSPI